MIKKFAKVNPEYKSIQCNGVMVRAKVANSDTERAQGLSGIKTLGSNEGMLFDFTTEQPVSFWMRGCLMDMDICFATDNKIIVGITSMSKDAPTHLHHSPSPVRYALEVPQGFFAQNSIAVGDKLSF
jgi:hypothetical protein